MTSASVIPPIIMRCDITAGSAERLYEAIVRQTTEACAILSSLPQSMISVTLQARMNASMILDETTLHVGHGRCLRRVQTGWFVSVVRR